MRLQPLTNVDAVQLMKKLPHITKSKKDIIPKAFCIYNQIGGKKDNYSINALLNLCCQANEPQILITLWPDIVNTNSIQRMSHPLIIKCCSDAMKNNITNDHTQTFQYIQILEYLRPFTRVDPADFYVDYIGQSIAGT
eukprot:827038_1